VKGAKRLGVRLGNWLTAEEARLFWQLPNTNGHATIFFNLAISFSKTIAMRMASNSHSAYYG
jgi:hypothetical protein